LHGAGERGTDNEAPLIHVLQDWFNDTESPIYQSIIIVPQCPEGEQWVNTPWENGSYDSDAVGESAAIKEALSILDKICEKESVNLDRIYVAGLSMGGYGTWNLLMNHSDIFAAGMPICGGADPSKANVLKDIAIYTFHGDRDSVVPVAGTREVVAAIQNAGGTKIYYEEVPNVDHNVWTHAASRGDILRQMFEQRKNNAQ
jgi:predicted peptidase